MSEPTTEDRLAIQELGARYAFRVDTKRYAEVSELFATDGVWDETVIGLPLCEGRAAIEQFFPAIAPEIEFVIHINANHQLTAFDGDTASGTTHLAVAGRFRGQDARIYGYYADDYVRVDGRWLFARRELVEITPSTGFSE